MFRFRNQIVLTLAFASLLAAAACGWWLCTHSNSIAFLPSHADAQWIIDRKPPETLARFAFANTTVFKKTFVLNLLPTEATISIRAFKTADVKINGQTIGQLNCTGNNWKSPITAPIESQLHAGTNKIVVSVTNSFGPPALWLHLKAGNFSLGTDDSWLASPIDSHWLNARMAAQPPALPDWSPLKEHCNTFDSVCHLWPELLMFAAISLALIFFVPRLALRLPTVPTTRWMELLLILVIVARAALFLNDVGWLPGKAGFDAQAHEAYIRFIQQKKALPLPNNGWEMHQPPLYYLISALWLGSWGTIAGNPGVVVPLRIVNCVVGMLQCWLALLCLRRLFPKNLSAQVVGLLIVGFLPADLYLSMYVTNDPLTALLVTAAFYFFLCLHESEEKNLKLALVIGFFLGAALLTKLNALLAVPVVLAAMGVRLILRKNFSPRDWFRSLGVVVLVCLATCGWHYGRVWWQIGALPLPNSQTQSTEAWWQDPGFRTFGYYLDFGQSLVSPLFSGLHSFADGIYSTLWGDGLISGYSEIVRRPPWNYDLMNAGYLLAVPLTLLAVIGLVIYLRQFLRTSDVTPLLMPGTLLAFAIGIVFLSLHSPWQASVKAFYALPGIVPFGALIAAGWTWLAQKNRVAQIALWTLMLVWALTVFSSFWIRSNNFEVWRGRAIVDLQHQNPKAAIADATRALQLNLSDPACHSLLAAAFNQLGQTSEAIRQYTEMLKHQPDDPATLTSLAGILANGDKADTERAIQLAQRACEITNYRQAGPVHILAVAYAKSGQMQNAIATAQISTVLALQDSKLNLLKSNRDLIERCRQNSAAGN